jgi:hypothetical protein
MRCDVRQRRICDAMLFKCDAMLFKCDVWERKARDARSLHRLRLTWQNAEESDEERGEAEARGASLPVLCFKGPIE